MSKDISRIVERLEGNKMRYEDEAWSKGFNRGMDKALEVLIDESSAESNDETLSVMQTNKIEIKEDGVYLNNVRLKWLTGFTINSEYGERTNVELRIVADVVGLDEVEDVADSDD